MPWLSVTIEAAAADVDALSDRLGAVGAVAVTLRPGDGVEPMLEPAPDQTPVWADVRLDALFPVDADLSPLKSLLAARGTIADVDFVEDEDWSEAWRASVVLQHYAGRLCVVPRDYPSDDLAGAVVRLDPGLAFGTGAHATTAMCLEALARRELDGVRVADVGSGSGILSLAALALGAAAVLAVDHDPQARLATRTNACVNEVPADRLATVAELPDSGAYDVIVANILANPLIELASRITALIVDGGTLILSGILDGQADRVVAAYPDVVFRTRNVRDGWVCVEGTKRSG